MALNPYAHFLEGRAPLPVIEETPARVEALAAAIGDAGMDRAYGPGKWTTAQILCHLADVEIAWGMRLRQAVAQPHHVIQPFEQDDWAKAYPHMDPHVALAAFLALRRWNVAFLKTVPETEHAKPVTHPERGTMTVFGMLQTMAGHDLNHLAQLEILAAG
jgi:uncharacterized damage-inducible protein DinB